MADQDLESDKPSRKLAAYWLDCLAILRSLKICDPACGSGAFLIQAYDLLEEQYQALAEQLHFHQAPEAETLLESVPDFILGENLYGVDLSEQAIEITQLSLWIRSARQGKTLADLSGHIRRGNSLVRDPAAFPHGFDWQTAFPEIFQGDQPGFDAVIGNPPWERLKLQEREYFAYSAPAIANAVSAEDRRQLIAELETANPELFQTYRQAKDYAERLLAYIRSSGQFPLTAKGDINTYMVFAELARGLVAPQGRVGLLVPSGIATDHTTKEFFQALLEASSLEYLYDFENRLRVFPDVDGRFKFCILIFGGTQIKTNQADFVFFAHRMEDLEEKTGTSPYPPRTSPFSIPTRAPARYFALNAMRNSLRPSIGRVPVLINENRREGATRGVSSS